MKLSAALAADALGLPLPPRFAETVFERVSSDSREELCGSLFVALKGLRFDGHDFAGEALAKGAAGLVVERGSYPDSVPVFRVGDTLEALGKLGLGARRKLGARVGVISGSFGKTTTKELAVLLAGYSEKKLLYTRGNLNNLVGMPKTFLGAEGDEEVAVIELGISVKGEMAALSRFSEPDVALLTGVGLAHTEGLGSLETVAAEKLKIASGLKEGGTLLLPHDHPLLKAPAGLSGRGIAVKTFGWDEGADFRGLDRRLHEGGETSFTVGGVRIRVSLPGWHNAMNALGAYALVTSLGVPLPEGEVTLASMPGAPLRGEIRETAWGGRMLVDCYNANPSAVAAAIDTLKVLAGDARKIIVLGEMRELGEFSVSAHREAGREAARAGAEKLFLFGPESLPAGEGALEAGIPATGVEYFDSREALAASLKAQGQRGDWLLLKGSRATRLDEVAARL